MIRVYYRLKYTLGPNDAGPSETTANSIADIKAVRHHFHEIVSVVQVKEETTDLTKEFLPGGKFSV